jgi:hypothetical protein
MVRPSIHEVDLMVSIKAMAGACSLRDACDAYIILAPPNNGPGVH